MNRFNESKFNGLRAADVTNWVGLVFIVSLTCACTVYQQPLRMYEDVEILEREYAHDAPDPTPILILGTFHFLCSTSDERTLKGLDMLSRKRQLEIEELLARLAEFRPTHIAVEVDRSQQNKLDERYESYISGQYTLTANEIDQIAFRLGEMLKHEKLYAVDAKGRPYANAIDAEQFAVENSQQYLLSDPIEEAWTAMHDKKDEFARSRTLIENLRVINSIQTLRLSHSIYLTRSLGITDGVTYPYADGFVSKWYNRNLRIFGNLLALQTDGADRILVLIGSGHAPILRHLAEHSGSLQAVNVIDVLPPRPHFIPPCFILC
ncbi:MAG: DUF5694 domain-containing protein [Pseudomonadota bacterium]